MLSLKKHMALAAFVGFVTSVGSTFAHTTVVPKNNPEAWESRDQIEGQTSYIEFGIPHGCDGQPITAQSVVFPNSANDPAVRTDTGEAVNLADHIIGNAVMSPRQVMDNRVFDEQDFAVGPVPEFDSHGIRNEDTRAFYFTEGFLPSGFVGLIPWRGGFPAFKEDSCATALRVDIAIGNYCTRSFSDEDNDRADIWIGHLTDLYNDPDVVSEGFWPFLRIVRDLENNPLPEGCEGYELRVSPSSESIDAFLPIEGYWPLVGDPRPFVAYNDLSWSQGQTSTDITLYTTANGSNDSPAGDQGFLIDHASGEDLSVKLTVEGGNWNGESHPRQGSISASGTDAYAVFQGVLDATGVISYASEPIVLTLEGLDPRMTYEILLFGNRDNSKYGERGTKVLLSGADSFRNASTAGALFTGEGDTEVTIQNGDNTQTGYLARYADVHPGSDGAVVVTCSGVGEDPKQYLNALCVRGTLTDEDGGE